MGQTYLSFLTQLATSAEIVGYGRKRRKKLPDGELGSEGRRGGHKSTW